MRERGERESGDRGINGVLPLEIRESQEAGGVHTACPWTAPAATRSNVRASLGRRSRALAGVPARMGCRLAPSGQGWMKGAQAGMQR